MHRKVRQYLKKSLCGILSAAMILTSLSVPDMTVRAAEVSVSEETELTKETELTEETELTKVQETTEQTDEAEETVPATQDEITDETDVLEENKTETADEDEVSDNTEDASQEISEEIEDDTESDAEEVTAAAEEKTLKVEEKSAETGMNLLKNGGFETIDPENAYKPAEWNIGWNGFTYKKESDADDQKGNYAYWYESSEETFINQTINGIVIKGQYKLSADVAGVFDDKTLFLKVKKQETAENENSLVSLNMGSGSGWGNWGESVSTTFEITENLRDIVISLEGTMGSGKQVQLDNVTLSPVVNLGMLKALVSEAELLDSSNYTTETWDSFSSILASSKETTTKYTDKDDTYTDEGESTEIAGAFNALYEAINNLVEKDVNVTVNFNYYAGDIGEKKIGVFKWGDQITTDAEYEDWKIWDSETNNVYKLTLTDYSGWYTIPLTFKGKGTDSANFQVVDNSGNADFKCGSKKSGEGNSEIFNAIFLDEANDRKTVAVKRIGENNYKLYIGNDADAVMRNITLYVYDDGTPFIGSESELSTVGEDTGELSKIDKKETIDGTNYYSMTQESGRSNWYKLTFSVPLSGENNKICSLYTSTENGYELKRELSADDVKVILGGELCYKDGKFYKSIDLAEGKTLKELEDLLTRVNAIVEKGESEYTPETWKTFNEAKENAEKVVADKKAAGMAEDQPDVEIAKVYEALETAEKNMVAKEKAVTFYYYNADISADDKLGLAFWDGDKSHPAESVEKADWRIWDDKDNTYEMTPVKGYAGWYSIPIVYTSTPAEDWPGFEIHKKSDTTNALVTFSNANNNYPNLEDVTAYAVKGNNAYKGEELVNLLLRNITLHVYSEEGVPAIGSADKISKVDESTGVSEEISADSKGGMNYYRMDAVEEESKWYELSFSIPLSKENGEICGLYTYADGEYGEPIATFADKTEGNFIDITPVFSGSVWYKNGKFYKDKVLAKGVTLGQLKQLLASDEVTAIVNNKDMYTTDSWDKFELAKTAAETVISKFTDDGEQNEEITTAYTDLGAAIEGMVSTGKVINLYYYSEALNEYTDTDTEKYGLYLSVWSNQKVSSTKEELQLSQGDWGYSAYAFEKVTDAAVNYGYDNWYSIPVKLIAANDGADKDGFLIQTGKASTADGVTTHTALEADTGLIKISYWENKSIYDAMTALDNNGTIAIKGTNIYASIYEAENVTIDKLLALYNEAAAYDEKDYMKGEQWDAFQAALAAAKAVIDKENPTATEIETAYNNLKDAMDALVYSRTAEINVKKVALADDFITGADLSSYIALKDSGVVFRDENGKPLSDAEFFSYLRDGGMNWVRIRIWNDPYNSSGNGYGGGNNDLDKAIRLGQMVTKAGMRVLIDFHYSDFWADPKKQKAPKAWAGYTVEQKEEAVYKFTLDSLNALRSAGVDVGMVQVGNETNNGIAGETAWDNMAKLFKAGSRAVREFDKNCLVAVHFTDPQKGYADIAKRLHDSEIDYDVFGSSYYPFGHGDASNLKSVLEYIVETYGKKVMAAETSWPTTLTDGDGYGMATPPSIPDMYKDQDYGVSVQGQADEMQELISKVNAINDTYPGKSIGVFYWEPAWISPYYIKDGEGNDNDSLYKQNFDLWEKYGSGWASSYAAEYDPDDAGVWFGGSAMDNSSWFDFDGTALPTAKIYSLVRTGASTTRRIASVDSNPVMKITVGERIDWSTVTVTAKYNDGTTEQKTVAWNEDEQKLVNTYKAGEYIVNGIVSTEDKEYRIKLTIQVLRSVANNILENPGFESGVETPWVIETRLGHGSAETDPVAAVTGEDPYSGTKGLHFWSSIGLDMTVSQTIKPEAGVYTFGSYIQGGGADREDVQYAFVTVKDKDGNVKYNLRASFTLDGWKNWSNPEITGITVEEGDTLVVGLIMKSTQDGAWGTIDDFYLYGEHTVSIDGNIMHGTVTANVVKANSGERIHITVTPENGYYPETLTLTGASVKADTLASSNGAVTYVPAADGSTGNQAVLTYTGTADEKTEIFMMPNGNVTVGATFKSIFEGKEKISLDAKDADGRYLVQVNGLDGESPIARQFHTGKDVKPEVSLSYMGYELTAADYTVTYENNKNLTTEDSKAKLILTAKGDKFAGTREILFEIAKDTREDFDKKTIQIAFVTPDKYPTNEKVTKPSDAVYYLGRQKAVEPGIRLYAADDTGLAAPIDESLYEVHYQNNKKIGKATLVVLPSDKALNDPKGYKEGSVTTTFTIAKCPVNQENVEVSVSKNPSYYTGKKVEHSVTVRYTYNEWVGGKASKKTITLAKGTDYTVTYTNNVNASVYRNGTDYVPIKPNKEPTIKIAGKGNFTGARTTERVTADGKPSGDKLTFEIRPKQLNDTVVTVADLAEKSSAQAPKITVKDGTKVIPANQYRIKEIVKTHDKDRKPLETPEEIYSLEKGTGTPKVQSAGTYTVTIEAKEKTNYEGAKTVSNTNDKLICRVVDKDHLIDNANIKINGKFYYTGEQITLSTGTETSNLVVKAGKDTVLTMREKPQAGLDGEDGYYVTYTNNVNAGKATVTVTGTGSYIGTKSATFSINKRTLANANAFTKPTDKLQKGLIQTPKLSEKGAVEKLDAAWIPAKDGKIINSDNGKAGEIGFLEVPYTGYTISPDFRFSSVNYNLNGEELTPKELSSGDYTVSYKVGAWKDNKAPVTVTVKGKGNYSGSVKFDNLFTLTARNLKDLNIDIVPVTYNGSALKPAVVFYDKETGKAVDLKLNTAYTVSYKNNKDTAVVNKNPEKQPEVTLKVKGKGWITDKNDSTTTTWSKKFVIGQAEITSADVEDVVFQSFLGKALKPKVTVKVNGKKLKEGKDYVLTYSNNVRRGSKATVRITGKGNYYTSEPIQKVFVIK